MATATWQALVDLLDPYEMTIQQQALSPLDRGEMLLWDSFFPRQNVDSVELNHLTTVDYRPTADRREWGARGRYIPLPSPPRRKVSIVPIEGRHKIEEYEMQRLGETGGRNGQQLRDMIGVTIPKRTDMCVESCYRCLEFDAFKAWSTGTIIQRNPENGVTYTASFGFPGARYTTAGTAWSDPSVNAYTLLLAWITETEDQVGPIKGVMLRLATLNAILADAPNLPNGVQMTRSALEGRLSEDIGKSFQFYVNETTVQIFDDGGTARTSTKVWPTQTIAAVPQDGRIGNTAFAPVIRAMELQANTGDPSGIDVRGVTVYYESAQGGRELTIEAQLNALPVPDEQRVKVTNVGV